MTVLSIDRYTRLISTREQAHVVITEGYSLAKALLVCGKRVRITVEEAHDSLSIRQRNFLHGAVLPQISRQVRVEGVRFVQDAWEEYFRKEFLGHRYEMRRLPFAKKATPVKVRISTEDLSDREYSEYIDRVIAHAVTEWSVAFRFIQAERDAVRYRQPKRAHKPSAKRQARAEATAC